MTLEYRCSNCGTLLQTTNADAVDAEIERLRAALKDASRKLHDWAGWDEPSGMLLDDLADDLDKALGC